MKDDWKQERYVSMAFSKDKERSDEIHVRKLGKQLNERKNCMEHLQRMPS
jgi:hypothetical protein